MIPIIEKLKNQFIKERPSVGLDIGSANIKLVVLEKKNEGKILKKLASVALVPGTDLAVCIKKFMESQGIPDSRVNISVSGPSVIMRYIVLPRMTLPELKSTMQFEAKQYIPFSLDEMILDCAIVTEKVDNNKMLAVFAAIKKIVVEERISLIEKAGLMLGAIDVDCFCLANAFSQCPQRDKGLATDNKTQVTALLNIGARATNMAITDDGSLRFSRDIAYGGAEPTLNNLAAEINSSIDYYENQNGKPVERIYVSGGSSMQENIQGFLAQQLNLSVSRYEFFSGISADQSIDQNELKTKGSMFAVALGLALR